MARQNINVARWVLLAVVVLLLCLTAYLYFQTGKFNLAAVVVALGCLGVFLVTGRRRDGGKQ